MIRRPLLFCVLVAALGAPASSWAAEPELPAAVAVGDGSTLPDVELDRLRGGFLMAGGLTVGFGAITRTVVDGQLALETQLTWTAEGAQVTRTAGAGVGSVDAAALAAAGIHAGDLGPEAYVTPDGRSAVIQRVTTDGLTNVILNTASNRAISQSTDVTLSLPGFQAVQGRLSDAASAARFAEQISSASLMATRH